MHLTIHTDGGSLNNPGPAASAFVIEDNKKTIKESSFYLGTQTNNVAEYMGIIYALEEIYRISKNSPVLSCRFISDSLLMVNQIRGIYKVKQDHLKPLHQQVLRLVNGLGVSSVTFEHTLREGNKRADALVKKELSSHS